MSGSVENAVALATRLESFDAKVNRIIDNDGGKLTAGAQGIAIAMAVTLALPLFADAAKALRSLSNQERQ